jgi:hypothetical protein
VRNRRTASEAREWLLVGRRAVAFGAILLLWFSVSCGGSSATAIQELKDRPEYDLVLEGSELVTDIEREPIQFTNTGAQAGHRYASEADGETVIAFFDDQLTAAGWVRRAGRSGSSMASAVLYWDLGDLTFRVAIMDERFVEATAPGFPTVYDALILGPEPH